MFSALIRRDLLTAWRRPQAIVQPIIFFLLVVILFPIGLGTDADSLRRAAPAVLWIALLLAILLASGQLFASSYDDGTLIQDRIHLTEFWLAITARLCTAWLQFILPFLIVLPLAVLMLNLPAGTLPAIALQLAIGSLSLLFIGAIGAALTLTQNHNTFLLFLIAVPFYIPALIIGATATQNAVLGLSWGANTALLAALMCFSGITALPFAAAAVKNQQL